MHNEINTQLFTNMKRYNFKKKACKDLLLAIRFIHEVFPAKNLVLKTKQQQ